MLFLIPAFGFTTLLFAILTFPLLFVFGPRISRIGPVLWGRITALLTPVRVCLLGEENIDPNKSYIIVANHQSNYDILSLYGWLPIDFRWVMKKEIGKIPVIGFYSRKSGQVLIDRSNTSSALESLNRARSAIKDGTSILFFPEGTRSKSDGLLPFKKGAFRMAVDMKLPILPITLVGAGEIMPPGTLDISPGRIDIIVHGPIDTSRFSGDIEGLMELTRSTIKRGIPSVNNKPDS